MKLSRYTIVSLLCALAVPAAIVGLEFFVHGIIGQAQQTFDIFAIAITTILSPMAAAFFGHAARRQIRKNGNLNEGGYRLATLGLALGYFELSAIVLLFLSAPPHSDRRALYEASAVGSLLTVNRAERAYSEAHPKEGYTKGLQDLVGSDSQSGKDWFVDETLARGVKSHYKFTYTPNSSKQNSAFDRYKVFADPTDQDMRHFFTDETGVIRYTNEKSPANESSKELK